MLSLRQNISICSLLVLLSGCRDSPLPQNSTVDVTVVEHTSVKRQAIGNCWLYAMSSWLESMLKSTLGEEINVSETYWTYWDLYEKLEDYAEVNSFEKELNTSGSWYLASYITKKYGWVEEKDFIPAEADMVMSDAQLCAQNYLKKAILEAGSLAPGIVRTPELLRAELNKAFSCAGRYTIDIDAAFQKRRLAEETQLKDPKTGVERTLTAWIGAWKQVNNPGFFAWDQFEGKKLPTEKGMKNFENLGLRIRKALNDHQPVVLTFFVSFNAPNESGLFNLQTLAEKGDYGTTGGHIVVLHDYTVKNVPGVGAIGEGDLDEASKNLALTGDLDYLIAKNSWGFNRFDRPWIGNGYSRISWDYLSKTYYDADSKYFFPFLGSVAFPPGY